MGKYVVQEGAFRGAKAFFALLLEMCTILGKMLKTLRLGIFGEKF